MTKKEAMENAQELLQHTKDGKLNIELEDKKVHFNIDEKNKTITAVQLDNENNVIDSTKYNFNKNKEKDIKNVKDEDEKYLTLKGLDYTDFKTFSEFCCIVVASYVLSNPKTIKIDNEAIEKLDKELEEQKNKENEKNNVPETEKENPEKKENLSQEKEPWDKQEKNPWEKSKDKKFEKDDKEKEEKEEKPTNPWAEKLKNDKENELER